MQLNKPLVFCGYMGVGKTTLAKSLAKKYNYSHCDLDEFIEQKSSLTIANIFSTLGEKYFRNLEKTYLPEILENNDIVSLGGGTLLDQRNIDLISRTSFLIHLENTSRYLNNEENVRPLWKQDQYDPLYQQRLPGYLTAQMKLDLEKLEESVLYDKLDKVIKGLL